VTAYTPRWFTRPQAVTHLSTNPAVHGRELNSQPVDHKSDGLTTTLPSDPMETGYYTGSTAWAKKNYTLQEICNWRIYS